MAYFEIFRGTQSEVNAQAIIDGQMLYTTDLGTDNKIYADVGSTRTILSNAKDVRSAEKLRNLFTTRPTSANLPIVGDGSLKEFKATGSMTEGRPPQNGHILHFEWDNGGGYNSQLAIGHSDPNMFVRGMSAGVWSPWIEIYTARLDGSETPTASNLGTITAHTAIRRGGVVRYKLQANSGTWTGGTSYNLCTLPLNYRPVVSFSKRIMLTETINAVFSITNDGNVYILPSSSMNGSAFRIDETYTI